MWTLGFKWYTNSGLLGEILCVTHHSNPNLHLSWHDFRFGKYVALYQLFKLFNTNADDFTMRVNSLTLRTTFCV